MQKISEKTKKENNVIASSATTEIKNKLDKTNEEKVICTNESYIKDNNYQVASSSNTQDSLENSISEEEKQEKAPRIDMCDLFMQTNVELMRLYNDYLKIQNSFKDSRARAEKRKAEIKYLKDENKELKELLDTSREQEKEKRARIFQLENKQAEYINTIKEKDKLISERDKTIDVLTKELAGRDEMIEIINKDGSKQSDEIKNKMSSALKLDYQEYLECKNEEISVELGDFFRTQLGNIFELLKKEGIPLE